MVHTTSSSKRNWVEGISSALTVATAIPASMNTNQLADIFEKIENKTFLPENYPLCPELVALRNSNGETLLIAAARSGNYAAVKHLSADPEILDDEDGEGWSALLNACSEGHYAVIKELLESGASVDLPDLLGWSPLMWAIYKNHVEVVELLLHYRAHVNLIDEEDGLTPLMVAAGRGSSTIVEMLLKHKSEDPSPVNACDKFGSTALIWAARRGHIAIVEMLLNVGSEVDAVGMYGSTALMQATKGNFVNVVDLILTRSPNINVTDADGQSALGIAAKEGYADICESLINAGAFVNQCDRSGTWILNSAVRSGNVNIVRLLLEKFVDVNCKDIEGRTPLHLAIDKSFSDIVLILLERKPNLELKNKDGETPLLRAAKIRHVALCQLLVNAGAKISAADEAGDNAVHIALRARSKRLTQALLPGPSDSRLLYRPNKEGLTPYAIDAENPQPILPLIFGPMDAQHRMDSMMGYDMYSDVLADIVAEPCLALPLTIGLYAKWGSGKSILLAKLKSSIHSFSRNWLDSAHLQYQFSMLAVFYIFVICFLSTLTIATIAATSESLFLVTLVGFLGLFVFIISVAAYGIVFYGSVKRSWNFATKISIPLARFIEQVRLVWDTITLHAPISLNTEIARNPVSFLFADYHRLSSIGGEHALCKIVTTLFEAAENHFGTVAVRMFCAIGDHDSEAKGLRRVCGMPIVMIFLIASIFLSTAEILLIHWLLNYRDHANLFLFFSIGFFTVFALVAIYPTILVCGYVWTNIPNRRINTAIANIDTIRFEGLMQKLQTEVDLLADMVRVMDAFTKSQTRLVVIVDGLDNCEQERMIQSLDALDLLFSARKHRPFITIIAVDPHIIVSAINHNMHTAISGTELTGHDYMKNIVNMPFYLHNTALTKLKEKLRAKRESFADWKDKFKRQDTFHGSYLSLRGGDLDGRQSRKATAMMGAFNTNDTLLIDDYFSNMNPRAMRRIVNALTLTGRLMRSFDVDFTWTTLGHWVSLIEQWPCRMCWLIDRALDLNTNNITLVELYNQLKDRIPKKDSLIELDRNPDNFESFLDSLNISPNDQLTVGHVKKFVTCTSNLDPYLRKLIRERRQGLAEPDDLGAYGTVAIPLSAKYLFTDEKVWSLVTSPLVEMKLSEVVSFIRRLDLSTARIENLVQKFEQINLNGLVLASCQMQDLKDALNIPLGDWTLVRLLIETLKSFGTNVPGIRLSRRKALTLKEEDEEMEDELDVDNQSVLAGPVSAINAEQRRRSIALASSEMNDGHKWLMDSLSVMDFAEPEGDMDIPPPSAAPSVRFDDMELEDGEASDKDSTESRYGSQDNLLDRESALSRHSSTSRSELLRNMQGDSIHSVQSQLSDGGRSGRSSILSSEEQQRTVMRREDRGERPNLSSLFPDNNISK